MNEQNWKRKDYDTWDEAFKGLAPVIRQQSVRVAAYTQVLFVQACASSFGVDTPEGADRMIGKYADLAYKCGLYHQLGKAMVPHEYQIWQKDFTEEEKAVYRKYTTDGRWLVASLQVKGVKAKEKRTGEEEELPTQNIPWLMLRETCAQHMERYDGSGYPQGMIGNQISPIAQIVGLAKEFDRIASETKSDHPFEDAFDAIMQQTGTGFSPELVEVLKACKKKCRAVYKKYIHYTLTIPKTIPLVDKHKDRPMGLKYRPMIQGKEGKIVAYEAVPWFAGILDRPGETESAEELEPVLTRTKLVHDMMIYLLYEAADTVLRMQNCKLALEGVLVPVFAGFYRGEDQSQALEKLFHDQPIDRKMLMLTVPEKVITGGKESTINKLVNYIDNGISLVLDDYHPENIPMEKLIEIGFTQVRIAPELYLKRETAEVIEKLKGHGIKIIGGGIDNHDAMAWLTAAGASYMSGTMSGMLVTEEELIRDALLSERES